MEKGTNVLFVTELTRYAGHSKAYKALVYGKYVIVLILM